MRRTDREITQREAREILERGEYAILSTVDEDGTPYGVPVSYAVVGDRILVHGTAEGGERLSDVTREPRVCLTVVGSTEVMPQKFSTLYESVIVRGTASVPSDRAEKLRALAALVDKYSPDFSEKGAAYAEAVVDKVAIVSIKIETISGKARRAHAKPII